MNRYAAQIALSEIGEQGQRRLSESKAAVVGCGALGTHAAELLVRAGVGFLRILDRDIVDLTNLHRQVLFDERDARDERPKAEAVEDHLRAINSEVTIESLVLDFRPANAIEVLSGMDVILDATDNFEARYLLNDAAVQLGIPWVYGGVTATEAMVLPILPGESACLRCLFPDPPVPGSLPTCQTSGVINTGPALAAALQVTAAIQFLIQGRCPGQDYLHILDLWSWRSRNVPVARSESCPTCGKRHFDFLDGQKASRAEVLCGRDSVQVFPPTPVDLDLGAIARRLSETTHAQWQGSLLRLDMDGHRILLFPDGRMLVRQTTDTKLARVLYARLVGI